MKTLAIASLSLCATLASAHVSIDPPRAETGKLYRGLVRIGHGCDNAPTTVLELRLPAGTTRIRSEPSLRWQSSVSGTRVVWTADPDKPLPPGQKDEMAIEFEAPKQAGPMWIGAQQRCGATVVDWAEVPKQGTSTEGMKTPALVVQVVSAQEAAAYAAQPTVEGAWVRASVPGQQATGAFMRITAKEPTQLVRASSPVAGTAAVHEMKMEGDVMRMRPAGAIDLPAGKAFELNPGGYHLMLQDLKKPLESGSTVPVTLVFRSAKGVETSMELKLPVAVQPPTGAAQRMDHKH